MEHYGVVLRNLRQLQKLPIKVAARKIGRSAGWLSEIENERGQARIHPAEFERIIAAYGAESYRKQFGIWVARAYKPATPTRDASCGGPVLKYLRKKAGLTLKAAAAKVHRSGCYLSLVETGGRTLSPALRDQLMRVYGYSPGSFKNFTTEDKRAKNIPGRYKLRALLRQLDDQKINQVLGFVLTLDRKAL